MRGGPDSIRVRVGNPRRRIIILSIVVLLIILLFSLRTLSGLYIQSLWYSSIGQHEVFTTQLETKIGLFLTFGLIFFLAMWVNLLLCNRLGPSELFLDAPEDELVRRFQGAVRPYAARLYALLAFVLAFIAASSAVGNWQSYLLFANAKSFGIVDPLFHKDVGFYVFQLPFLTFVVDWLLASLVAIIVFTVVFHYLNGGIRAARVSPRVSPGVKVHLSVLIALLALAKAAGYLIARWHMVTSASANDGIDGGGYTDVHARLPALMLLFWLCLAAAVILLVNIRQRGWTLPVIAIGLWAFVALVIGVIYPAVLQALKVTPAQSTLEAPYIKYNIAATRQAYDIENVATQQFKSTSSKPLLSQPGVSQSLVDIRQWDPAAFISGSTFAQLQQKKNYYAISPLGEDRYDIAGHLTPVIIGLRELSSSGVPNATWVNTHLVYTHGIGVVMIPSNATSGTKPIFTEYDVPPVRSSSEWPLVTTPDVYYGLTQSGFVVVDSKLPELDFQTGDTIDTTHDNSHRGVEMGGFLRRAMLAIHFGDLNLLTSNDITSDSRILFNRNPVQIAQLAAPFLSIDAHPYAVIADGHLDWILDGYTTTSQYPYSQNANTQLVPADNGLPSSYNYVRNSVKIVVDAYSGQVSLYAMPQPGNVPDPILEAWESVYPKLIQPYSAMPTQIRDHLKYPEDIFSIQAAIYGRYHITTPSQFYSNGEGWQLSPTDGAGPPNATIEQTTTYDKQGNAVSTTNARMDPLYQIYALPGTAKPVYTLTDAFVAAQSGTSSSSTTQATGVLPLTAFLVALSDPGDYGELKAYQPPSGVTVPGPVQADAAMYAYPPASKAISLLHQNNAGSQVLLGNVMMVPVDGSMLYVRPLYVSATATALPLLKDFIAVYKSSVGFYPTLGGAVTRALSITSSTPTTVPTSKLTVKQLLNDAVEYNAKANAALADGDLGSFQHYLKLQAEATQDALNLLNGTTPPPKKATNKSTKT